MGNFIGFFIKAFRRGGRQHNNHHHNVQENEYDNLLRKNNDEPYYSWGGKRTRTYRKTNKSVTKSNRK
jgi:hypothetical protein